MSDEKTKEKCMMCGDPAIYKHTTPLRYGGRDNNSKLKERWVTHWCDLECYNFMMNDVSQYITWVGQDMETVNRHEKPLRFEQMTWQDQWILKQQGWEQNPNWELIE